MRHRSPLVYGRYTSNCSHYAEQNCSLPAGALLPGRAGSGSTTSYTGLAAASATEEDGTGILISYDYLADGWQPVPSGGYSNFVFVVQVNLTASG